MHNIKTLAYDFLLESKIDSLPITLKKLNTILAGNGTALLPYSKAKQVLAELPEMLRHEVTSGMQESDGLTVVIGKNVIILYSDELSYGKRLLVTAHEIGHQYIGHKRAGVYVKDNKNDTHEQEAQAFAFYVLAPPCILRTIGKLSVERIAQLTGLDKDVAAIALKRISSDTSKIPTAQEKELRYQFRHYINDNKHESKSRLKRTAAACMVSLSVIVAITLTLLITKESGLPATATLPSAVTQTAPAVTEKTTVWKSKTGDIYHTDPNCYHIPKTAYTMNLNDAVNAGYRKCKNCKK